MYNREESQIQKPRAMLEAQEGLRSPLSVSISSCWSRAQVHARAHKSRAQYAQNTSIFKK